MIMFHVNTISIVHEKLGDVLTRCDDAESRVRRCNLLFFGLSDDSNETWNASEQKLVNLCAEKLESTIAADNIERAHRLGKLVTGKDQPIIVRFLRFKDNKQNTIFWVNLKTLPSQ